MDVISTSRFFIILRNFCADGYFLYLLFAVIGLLRFLTLKKIDCSTILILIIFVANTAIFCLGAKRPPGERRFFINVPLLMPFTLIGIKQYYDFFKRKKLDKLAVTLLILLIIHLAISSVGIMALRDKSDNFLVQIGRWIELNKSRIALGGNNKEFTFLVDNNYRDKRFAYWAKSNCLQINIQRILNSNITKPVGRLTYQYYPVLKNEFIPIDLLIISNKSYQTRFNLIKKYEEFGLISKISAEIAQRYGYNIYKVNKNIRVRSLLYDE